MLERLRKFRWTPLASIALPSGLLLVANLSGSVDAVAGPPGRPELPAAPFASVNGENRIDNLTVEELSDGTTTLRLKGTRKPTFNVYRIENPDRLVVDISGSERGKAVPHVNVDSWAVGRVALDASDENGADVVRVLVDLKRDASYIVVPKGNELLVTITPRDVPPEAYFNRKGAGARKAELEALEREAQARASKAEAMAKEAEKRASEAEAKAKQAAAELADADTDRKFIGRRKRKELEELRAEKMRMETEAARARKLADESMKDAVAARAAAEREASEILAAANGYAKHKRLTAEQEALKLRKAAEAERKAAEAEAKAARAEALAHKARAEGDARATRAKAESEAKKLRAAAEKLRVAASRKRAEAEAEASEIKRQALATQAAALEAKQAAQAERKAAVAEAAAARAEAEAFKSKAEGEARKTRVAAEQAAEKLRAQAERLRQEATKKRQSADVEAERIRKLALAEKKAAEAEAAATRAEAQAARARAEGQAKQTLKKAEGEAQRLRTEAERLKIAAQTRRREADAEAAKILENAKIEASKVRGEAAELRRVAEAQQAQAKQMLADAEAAMSKAKEERSQARRARAEAEDALEEAQKASKHARRSKKDELQRAVAQAEQAKAAADRRHKAAQARIAKLDADRTRLEALVASQAKRSEDLTRSIEQKQDELGSLRSSVAGAKAELAKLEERARRSGKASDHQKQKLADKQHELAAAESSLHTVKNSIDDEARRLAELQEQVAAAQARLDDTLAKNGAGKTRLKDDWNNQKDSAPRAKIKDVRFEDGPNAEKVIIEVDGPIMFAGSNITPTMKSVTFDSARIPKGLERSLDASSYDGPVGMITSFREGDQVKVIVATREAVQPQLQELPGKLVWIFPRSTPKKQKSGKPSGTEVVSLAGSQVAGFATPPAPLANGSSSYGRRSKWRGERIDIELQDAPIKDVLLLFSDIGRVNIIAGSGVDGIVTMRLSSVPWDQALDIILRSLGLGMVQEGNVIRVATIEDLEEERRAAIEKANAQVQLKPLETRLVPLSYSTVGDMIPKVQSVLSSRGSVTPDSRTNTLIIMDVVENIAMAEQLIASLDSQTPQVLIEARIVEARTNWLRQLGIQWGFDFISSPGTGNPTGLFFPNSVGVAGGSGDAQPDTRGLILPASAANPNYAVDLPAPVGTGSGGALGFSFGSLSGNLNTNLRLSAAEEEGEVRIISQPKIVTLDNTQAQIEQGVQIPISQVSAQGVNTRYVNATLALRVTPHVTNEGSVLLDVQVQKNEADFVNTGARGDPTILTNQAQSNMLINDGDTAVIGGIFTRNQSVSYNKVPWLADIPIIGWFFKNRTEGDTRSELLIFMTPKIVNRSTSIGG